MDAEMARAAVLAEIENLSDPHVFPAAPEAEAVVPLIRPVVDTPVARLTGIKPGGPKAPVGRPSKFQYSRVTWDCVTGRARRK